MPDTKTIMKKKNHTLLLKKLTAGRGDEQSNSYKPILIAATIPQYIYLKYLCFFYIRSEIIREDSITYKVIEHAFQGQHCGRGS